MTARRIFRPPLWASLLTPAAVAAGVALGVWQLGRGVAKARLQEELTSAAPASETLTARSSPAAETIRRVRAAGRYLPDRTLLLDGQSHAGQPGYHAWTPLRLADGGLVLVDRGWVATPADALAAPPDGVAIEGYWRPLPEPGLRLAASNPCPPRPPFPARVLYPTHAQLECILGERVVPGLLLLDTHAGGGFVRAWHAMRVPPQRHYAYAAQWFMLALLAAVLYVAVNFKRMPP